MVKTEHFCSCHGDTTGLALGDIPQSVVTAFLFFPPCSPSYSKTSGF